MAIDNSKIIYKLLLPITNMRMLIINGALTLRQIGAFGILVAVPFPRAEKTSHYCDLYTCKYGIHGRVLWLDSYLNTQ